MPIVLKWQSECTKVNITTFEIVVVELNHEFLNLPNRLFSLWNLYKLGMHKAVFSNLLIHKNSNSTGAAKILLQFHCMHCKKKMISCFNHRVVTMVADKLRKQWL